MKEIDVKIITEVLRCMQDEIFVNDEQMKDFAIAVENLNAEILRRKERYKNNIDVYRQRTREWKKNNVEKINAYQKEYVKRDYVIKAKKERYRNKRKQLEEKKSIEE